MANSSCDRNSRFREYGRIPLPDFMNKIDSLTNIVINIQMFMSSFNEIEMLFFKGNKVIRVLLYGDNLWFRPDLKQKINALLEVEDFDVNNANIKLKEVFSVKTSKLNEKFSLDDYVRNLDISYKPFLELGRIQVLNRKSFLKKLLNAYIEKWHANYERCDTCDGMGWEMEFWFAGRKTPVKYSGINYWPDSIALFSKIFEDKKLS